MKLKKKKMPLSPKQIIEGNRIIHCFMFPQITNDVKGMPDWWVTDFCRYNLVWDTLMPVVEKIESIYDDHHGYFGVHISANSCSIQGTNLWKAIQDFDEYGEVYCSDTNAIFPTKIESTWYNIVEFIKWWNNYQLSK